MGGGGGERGWEAGGGGDLYTNLYTSTNLYVVLLQDSAVLSSETCSWASMSLDILFNVGFDKENIKWYTFNHDWPYIYINQ